MMSLECMYLLIFEEMEEGKILKREGERGRR